MGLTLAKGQKALLRGLGVKACDLEFTASLLLEQFAVEELILFGAVIWLRENM